MRTTQTQDTAGRTTCFRIRIKDNKGQQMASSTVEESLPAPEDEVPEGFELPSVVSDEDRPPSLLQNCPSPTTDKMSFSNAIDEIGMGPFQSRLTVLCGMGWVIDAVEILVVAFVLEDIAVTFQLSSVEKGLIGSASFFGMLIGAGFWSIYADKRGRRTAFVRSLACVFVGGVASALAPSLLLLCLCRIVVGFGVGGNIPVTTALVTEFLPTKNRAEVLCFVSGTFWGIGIISASLLGLILANALGPGREESMWRFFLGFAAVPSGMVAVAYKLLPESPRYLSVMGRHDEAAEVLERVARVNGKLHVLALDFSGQEGDDHQLSPRSIEESAGACALALTNLMQTSGVRIHGFLVVGRRMRQGSRVSPALSPDPRRSVNGGDQVNGGRGDGDTSFRALRGGETVEYGTGYSLQRETDVVTVAQAGDVRELFHSPILSRITLCLWMVWIFLNISYYGLTFLLPRYYGRMSGSNTNSVYILTGLVGLAFIPGAHAAMYLCKENCLGRVGALKWSSFTSAVCIMLMALTVREMIIFSVVSLVTLGALAVPGTVMYVITPELYSTKYRAVGLGSCSVVTRLGGVVSPILAEVLYDKGGPIAPLVVFGPMMLIVAFFAVTITNMRFNDMYSSETCDLPEMPSAMIPIETAGRKLDDDSWDRRGTHHNAICDTNGGRDAVALNGSVANA